MRIHSLDSVRGIAAMLVVIYHVLIAVPIFYAAQITRPIDREVVELLRYSPLRLFWAGPEAVLLFFVLSGFVSLSALPFINQSKLNNRQFVIRRFCRIYLPYLVVMILSTTLMLALATYTPEASLSRNFNARWAHPVDAKAFISYVFMLGYDLRNVNGSTWSLVHELRISMLFPILMHIVLTARTYVLAASVMAFVAAYTILTVASDYGNWAYHDGGFLVTSLANTIYYIPFFIFGALLARHLASVNHRLAQISGNKKLLLLGLALLLCSADAMTLPMRNDARTGDRAIDLGITLSTRLLAEWGVAIGVLILFGLILNWRRLDAVLTRPTLLWMGKISFSVYLIHVPVIILAGRYLADLMPLVLALAFVPLITLPLAHVFYHVVEVPSIKIGKTLATSVVRARENRTELGVPPDAIVR